MHRFPIRDSGIVLPLRARLAAWAEIEDRRAHLLGGYNTRVSEITASLGYLLDALSKEAKDRSEQKQVQSGSTNPEVVRAFLDLVYRLAEMYELFRKLPAETEGTKIAKSAVRKYNGVIRITSRTACLICNKKKHDNYVVSRVDNNYNSGYYVEGFALFSRESSGSFKISAELHNARRPGISFNLGIRSLMFDFLRADVAAGQLCSALGAGETETPDPRLLTVLRRANSRPETGLRFELAKTITAMWEEAGSYVAGPKSRELPFLGNKVQVIQSFSGDGYTKTFPLAG